VKKIYALWEYGPLSILVFEYVPILFTVENWSQKCLASNSNVLSFYVFSTFPYVWKNSHIINSENKLHCENMAIQILLVSEYVPTLFTLKIEARIIKQQYVLRKYVSSRFLALGISSHIILCSLFLCFLHRNVLKRVSLHPLPGYLQTVSIQCKSIRNIVIFLCF
jgi:hypothetical protein